MLEVITIIIELEVVMYIITTIKQIININIIIIIIILEYVEAEEIFNNLLSKDPYRIDQMDLYSNILYVVEGKTAKLSFLAHITSSTDKFRAETMCVVGKVLIS